MTVFFCLTDVCTSQHQFCLTDVMDAHLFKEMSPRFLQRCFRI